MKLDNRTICASYGRRAAKSRNAAQYQIEGETLSMEQIAARIGLSECATRRRMKRLPAPITWEKLKHDARTDRREQ